MMDFPTRIRSEVSVALPPGSSLEGIRARVVHRLVSKGAVVTSQTEEKVQFKVTDAVMNWNPLAQCGEGSFKVEATPAGIRLRYDLDVVYFIQQLGFMAFLFVPLILLALAAALFQGAYALLAFLVLAALIGLPGTYLVRSWQVKSLFKTAIRHG